MEKVIVVGAGPSGLAAAACLVKLGVPSLVLERDDCVGSLWRNRTYDRLRLHLPKKYSSLPYAPHAPSAPNYLPKDDFVRYLDGYAARFDVRVRPRREVRSARFDKPRGRWALEAVDLETGEPEKYTARYLVVATGENDEKVVPEVPGLEGFGGAVMHASEYKSAAELRGKAVLVVGCGNSGMEIALDLAEAGAATSIVVRSELHLVTKEMLDAAMTLGMFLPVGMVDTIVLFLCSLVFGDTSKHGLRRPAVGPFSIFRQTFVYPVVDFGTYNKIKNGQIQVLPALKSIHGNVVEFSDGQQYPFDAIIFATGYRSKAKEWLEDDDGLIGDDGMVKRKYPEHWKGNNRLYCVGLARRGIYGSGLDAQLIADDISKEYMSEQSNGF